MKHRNELNENEDTHISMFQTVTDKLDDPEYLETAINTASQVDSQIEAAAAERARNQLMERPQADALDDKEAACYIKRYPDVSEQFGKDNLEGAKHHWHVFGFR